MRDIGNVELTSQNLDLVGRMNGQPTANFLIYLRPGANQLEVKELFVERMNEKALELGLGYLDQRAIGGRRLVAGRLEVQPEDEGRDRAVVGAGEGLLAAPVVARLLTRRSLPAATTPASSSAASTAELDGGPSPKAVPWGCRYPGARSHRKVPPPLLAACTGNLRKLPSPTALPAMARIRPTRPRN